jgi:replicative DNA helicase
MRSDIEQALAGLALRDGSVVPLTGLTPADFSGALERCVWESVGELRGQGVLPDPLTVSEWIEQRYSFRCIVEVGRLFRESAGNVSNAGHLAARLREEVGRDRLLTVSAMLAESRPVGELVTEGMAGLMAVSMQGRKRGGWIREALGAVIDDLDGQALLPVVPSGFVDADRMLGGFHGGDLIVVAARPSMGKTAWGCNVLRNAADAGHCVGMISGEQPREQIAQRLIAIRGNVSLARMRSRRLEESDWTRITAATAAVKDYRLLIDDLPRPTIGDCLAVARTWKHGHALELLLVDYLQLIRAGGGEFRLQVGEVAQGLKALARELEIPVIVLAQVKREVESRPLGDGMGRLPNMGDIAESSIVEQVADQVLTLYRPGVYMDSREGEAFINVCKNRNGPTGLIPLSWKASSLRFENYARS